MKKRIAAISFLTMLIVSVLCLPVTVFAEEAEVALPDGYIKPIDYYYRNHKKVDGDTYSIEASVKDADGYYLGLEYVHSTTLSVDSYVHSSRSRNKGSRKFKNDEVVYNSIPNMKWERNADNGVVTISGTTVGDKGFSYHFDVTFSNIRFGALVDEKGVALDFNAGQVLADIKSREETTGDVAFPTKVFEEKDVANLLCLGEDGDTSIAFVIRGKDRSSGNTVNGGILIRFKVYGIKYKGNGSATIFADDNPGEIGVAIPAAIIVSSLGAGAAAAGAVLAGSSGKNDSPTSSFAMCVNKNFENTIELGQTPVPVFAHIVEYPPGGGMRPRPDLTQSIRTFSGDGKLIVQDGGITNGYRKALVSADANFTEDNGMVSFRFEGRGGMFTENIIFKIIQPEIVFAQDNLGLPAHHEKEVEFHFALMNMPDDTEVNAEIISPKNKKIYSIDVRPYKEMPRLYRVKLRDISPKDEADAGTTERHVLHVEAKIKADATRPERIVEKDYEIFRIHMGLVLRLEADAIGCYLRVKDGHTEMAQRRAAGVELGESLATPTATMNPMGALVGAGTEALTASTTSSNLNSWEKELCCTTGRIMLFFWDEEEEEIKRVPVVPDKEVEVRAIRVDNDKNSLIGPAQDSHQTLVNSLGIRVARTKDIDHEGMRIVKLCATESALDQPTRIRAEITVRATFRKKEYTVKKKVLLHSMPFRQIQSPQDWKNFTDYDEKITEQLELIMTKLKHRYDPKLEHYLPFYNLIDRMIKGYDFAFGYDQRQVDRVTNTWLRIVQGKLAGANEEAEKVTLADDIAAIYAFMQGMRDNGGILGRIALGICTYGYSEYLFFAMDAGEKMQAAVYSCKDDKDFGFWQGVRIGVEKYEKQLLMRAIMAGTLKGLNLGYAKIHGKLHGGYEKDILGTIMSKYRVKMDGIDSALRSKSVLYGKTAKSLDEVIAFTNGSARNLSNAMNRSKEALEASRNRVDSMFGNKPDPATMTPEQLKAYWKYELADQRADNEIFTLRRLMKEHGTARASGNLREADQAVEEFVYNNILQHKSTYNKLNQLDDPFATTMCAEVVRLRNAKLQAITESALDDIALKTGKNRSNLFVENATSKKAWRAAAGERGCMPNDYDLSVMELNRSDPSKSVGIDQSVGENALARATYRAYHGGKEAPSYEVAKEFTRKLDNTYVNPWMDQGNEYDIRWNPEAYKDLKALTDPKHYGDPLKGSGLDKKAFEHKVGERLDYSRKLESEADGLMAQAKTAEGAQREAFIQQANDLYIQSNDELVEGAKQLVKVKKITEGRNILHDAETGNFLVTDRVRDMANIAEKVSSENASPVEMERLLQEQYGTDLKGAARETANCLI